jgi:hypothetical protein
MICSYDHLIIKQFWLQELYWDTAYVIAMANVQGWRRLQDVREQALTGRQSYIFLPG